MSSLEQPQPRETEPKPIKRFIGSIRLSSGAVMYLGVGENDRIIVAADPAVFSAESRDRQRGNYTWEEVDLSPYDIEMVAPVQFPLDQFEILRKDSLRGDGTHYSVQFHVQRALLSGENVPSDGQGDATEVITYKMEEFLQIFQSGSQSLIELSADVDSPVVIGMLLPVPNMTERKILVLFQDQRTADEQLLDQEGMSSLQVAGHAFTHLLGEILEEQRFQRFATIVKEAEYPGRAIDSALLQLQMIADLQEIQFGNKKLSFSNRILAVWDRGRAITREARGMKRKRIKQAQNAATVPTDRFLVGGGSEAAAVIAPPTSDLALIRNGRRGHAAPQLEAGDAALLTSGSIQEQIQQATTTEGPMAQFAQYLINAQNRIEQALEKMEVGRGPQTFVAKLYGEVFKVSESLFGDYIQNGAITETQYYQLLNWVEFVLTDVEQQLVEKKINNRLVAYDGTLKDLVLDELTGPKIHDSIFVEELQRPGETPLPVSAVFTARAQRFGLTPQDLKKAFEHFRVSRHYHLFVIEQLGAVLSIWQQLQLYPESSGLTQQEIKELRFVFSSLLSEVLTEDSGARVKLSKGAAGHPTLGEQLDATTHKGHAGRPARFIIIDFFKLVERNPIISAEQKRWLYQNTLANLLENYGLVRGMYERHVQAENAHFEELIDEAPNKAAVLESLPQALQYVRRKYKLNVENRGLHLLCDALEKNIEN